MIAETIPALRDLSAGEKIILAAELCREAIAYDSETPDPALIQALQERLDHFRDHPDQVTTWEEVRSKILRKSK